MIEVTLVFGQRQIDLLVPSQITFLRLTHLIQRAFAEKGVTLPDGMTLALADKALAVGGYDMISSFGVGNGDRLQILT